MIKKRVLSALLAMPVLVFIFYWGGLPFLALNLALMTQGFNEYFRLVETKDVEPQKLLGLTIGWLFIIASYLDAALFTLHSILVFGFLALLVAQLINYSSTRSPLASAGLTWLGVFYVSVLINYLLKLYFLEVAGQQIGYFLVWLPILATWFTDTGAYFTGLNFGSIPLAPEISPNKTVEGAVGGLVGSLLLTLIFSSFFSISWLQAIGLGLVIGIVAQLGDLSISAFKRDAQLEDTGDLIPGHGGVLDRIDSLLFTLPVVYYYLQFIVF